MQDKSAMQDKSRNSSSKYSPAEIEPKWQNHWQENKTFKVEKDTSKPKYYILDMFPYPSGSGLHVGHPEGYTATDILARYKRMKGFNVLHPMGWDAFGLPAEQYALETGTHPAVTTRKNIETFKAQIKALGFSYDWDREVATCDPEYYRWTQWIFTRLYEKGLAYQDNVPVNWCPALGTVLANEEVIDGKSERGGHDVIRRPMKQWMLKITDYAESLLAGLDELDWPEGVKEMQRNWIGRSVGATVTFKIAEEEEDSGRENLQFEVFTTRPDTLFGATYAVLAPEHELIEKICSKEKRSLVDQYVEEAKNKSDRLRLEQAKQKTGVFTGGYAVNPANGERIPIYVADYVLITYGSGAIMAVPGHDERDWEFARKFDLPVVEVVSGGDVNQGAYTDSGKIVNSDFLDGLDSKEAKEKMIAWLEERGLGEGKVNYKLRDWLFSRQRYWGEPFPVVHTDDGPELVAESSLPVHLPEVERYQPTEDGKPPLARAEDWLETTTADGKAAIRETNTMPQWAGSCWYYLRFLDPKNTKAAWDQELENYWMPVDLYLGGVEHAVLHLLYSRFWHHVLHDLGLVSTREPFKRLVNQGMILGEDNQKMSKSRGNVVNPDDMIEEFGADTLRIYEMFMGPLEQVKPWNTKSAGGVYRFLNRVWSLLVAEDGTMHPSIDAGRIDVAGKDSGHSNNNSANFSESEIERSLHRTIEKVTEDIESLKFHTAIAALMSFVNELSETERVPERVIRDFVLLLSPFAPHLGEELWQRLGNKTVLAYESWPVHDPELAKRNTVTLAIQVNGKLRDTIEVPAEAEKSALLEAAKSSEKVAEHLKGKSVVREVVVPGRLVNFVVK